MALIRKRMVDMQIARVRMEQLVHMNFECLGQWECLFERFVVLVLYHYGQDSRETERGRQLMLRWAKGEKLLDMHRLFS